MINGVFAIATTLYVGSAFIYSRASALTLTVFGRMLFVAQVALAIALAAVAFDGQREIAWIWLAYACVVSISRARAASISVGAGLRPLGVATPFVKGQPVTRTTL
jgi:hypothetical protein